MAITITPEEPRATLDGCHIVVAAADYREDDNTGDPIVYTVRCTSDDWDGKPLVSHEFTPSHDEEHRAFEGLIFPVAGDWDVDLLDMSDDSVVQTLSVTVS